MYKQAGQAKAAAVNELIPADWKLGTVPSVEEQRDVTGAFIRQHLSPREVEITETDAVGIVARTTTGLWSAVDVAKAFCHRAAIAHQLVNCLHEIFFEDALAQAGELDAYYAKHKKPIGPLHGLPVSLKDQFHVKGVETTMGYVGWIGTFEGVKGTGKEKVFESEMVQELRSLGATLYCKTSVPNTLMCGETVNNIIGYTWNPANRNLSCGGSSGGEGALIALKGSPVGFGTDIGGSIRIPAAFNGLYGLRPSSGRLPYEGMANSFDGQNTVLSVVGPLATTVGALQLMTKAVLSKQPWLHDPLVAELPWRPEAEQTVLDAFQRAESGLSFGFLPHDGHVTPHPPVRRALEKVRAALEGLGHQMIDWKPSPSHPELSEFAVKAWCFDGGADTKRAHDLSGEIPAPQIFNFASEEVTATDIMKTNIAKRQAQKAYMEYWNSTAALTTTGRPVDALICPAAPFAAARPGKFNWYAYSSFVNVLDYSSVVVPVLRVDKSVDKMDRDYKPLNEDDRSTYESCKSLSFPLVHRTNEVLDDAEVYDGAHVAIQLVGRRFQEEKVLALAEYLSEALANVSA